MLGAILKYPVDWPLYREQAFREEDFDGLYWHQLVWRAIEWCDEHGVPPDDDAAATALTRMHLLGQEVSRSDLSALLDGVPRIGPSQIRAKAEELRKLSRGRHAIELIHETVKRIALNPDAVGNLPQLATHLTDLAAVDVSHRQLITALPEFLAEWGQRPPAAMLIENLLPGDGIVLFHGQPRARKTQTTQSILLSLASGRPAFNDERFHVNDAVPVLYITEEDGPGRNAQRLAAHLRGLGLSEAPRNFHVRIHKRFSLDDPECQHWLIEVTKREGFRLVEFDPLRSMTELADQGPRDFKPAAKFLRDFTVKTGAVALIAHHDAKPPVNGSDTRARPQRASGGGLFSIADAPIHLEALDSSKTLVAPTAWKFGTDPDPFILRLESDDTRRPTMFRFHVEDTSGQSSAEVALHSKIVGYVRDHSGASKSQIAKGVRAQKETVLRALEHMACAGMLNSFPGPRNSTRWFLSEERSGNGS